MHAYACIYACICMHMHAYACICMHINSQIKTFTIPNLVNILIFKNSKYIFWVILKFREKFHEPKSILGMKSVVLSEI